MKHKFQMYHICTDNNTLRESESESSTVHPEEFLHELPDDTDLIPKRNNFPFVIAVKLLTFQQLQSHIKNMLFYHNYQIFR